MPDDHPDETTVWIRGRRSTDTRRYHTDPDCQYVTSDYVAKPLQFVPASFDECKVCAGTDETAIGNIPENVAAIVEELR